MKKSSSRLLRSVRRVWWFSALAVFGSVPTPGQPLDEYEVKAAFIFNFTKFIEWPKSPSTSPFAVCVLGSDPFGSTLDAQVLGKQVSGRTLEVRRLRDVIDAKQCQIVFVRQEEQSKAAKLVEAVQGLPVLTVGESREFAGMGGMIYLSQRDGRVVVGVNTAAADKAKLRISAKLLSIAKNFKNDREEER